MGILATSAALADPTRLRILALLRGAPAGGEVTLGELAEVLGQSQPRVSRHVRILAEAGLIDRRREGSWLYLAIAATPMVRRLAEAADAAGLTPVEARAVARDKRRLAAVTDRRRAVAERWFADNAAGWDAIRALHVPDGVVEAMMRRMLGRAPVGRLADVGTGTGRMAVAFGPGADTVIAIDRSPEMLRLARARCQAAGLPVDLRQGRAEALPLDPASVDTVILHHLLHHLDQPGTAIAEAGRVLAPGGRLLIADFAPHDREELRQAAAHLRLGFADEQIESWCKAAGLSLAEVKHLPGDPLTIIVWLATAPQAAGPPTGAANDAAASTSSSHGLAA